MVSNGTLFLIFVVSALTVFGGTLGWASWMESRGK